MKLGTTKVKEARDYRTECGEKSYTEQALMICTSPQGHSCCQLKNRQDTSQDPNRGEGIVKSVCSISMKLWVQEAPVPMKKPSVVVCACDPSTGEAGTRLAALSPELNQRPIERLRLRLTSKLRTHGHTCTRELQYEHAQTSALPTPNTKKQNKTKNKTSPTRSPSPHKKKTLWTITKSPQSGTGLQLYSWGQERHFPAQQVPGSLITSVME